MPHQCLKCGKVFEEGSPELLKGCPGCGGNRFFFTKEALTDEERSVISTEVEQDITSKLMDLMGEQQKEKFEKSGKWTAVKPKEIRKIIEQQAAEDKPPAEDKEKKSSPIDDEYRKQILEKLHAAQDGDDAPETIDIECPGKYKIDLKGLLEQEPIIIQKDGTYTIHLPSIFKMIDKEK